MINKTQRRCDPKRCQEKQGLKGFQRRPRPGWTSSAGPTLPLSDSKKSAGENIPGASLG